MTPQIDVYAFPGFIHYVIVGLVVVFLAFVARFIDQWIGGR